MKIDRTTSLIMGIIVGGVIGRWAYTEAKSRQAGNPPDVPAWWPLPVHPLMTAGAAGSVYLLYKGIAK